ncbi:hypothetical protein FRB94_010033 [Tulasnella sp. JGI-2019a]|nr:hypothetical protein FRB94_010033 [Tulasnella sp. JGI-2019a]
MEGDLAGLIKSRQNDMALGMVASIYRQLVNGLKHIHANGYFHRRIEPEHILTSAPARVKYRSMDVSSATLVEDATVEVRISGFGRVRKRNSTEPSGASVSKTTWYRAPEVLVGSTSLSASVDMWAVGLILIELVTLKPAFKGDSNANQLMKIVEVLGGLARTVNDSDVDERGKVEGGGEWVEGLRLGTAAGLLTTDPKAPPKPLRNLFQRRVPDSLIYCVADLLRYDPEKRVTAEQCTDHPYWIDTRDLTA